MRPYYRYMLKSCLSLSITRILDHPFFKIHFNPFQKPQDLRSCNFEKAKKMEVDRHFARKVWKPVCCIEVSDNACILARRFKFAIKVEVKDQKITKAHFVVQWHRDKLRNQFVDNVSVPRPKIAKMFIRIGKIFGISLFVTNLAQKHYEERKNWRKKYF